MRRTGARRGSFASRPDNPRKKGKKEFKYESPYGKPLQLYFGPTATPAALADPAIELCVVEGEKKTLRAAQEGLVAVGVASVWSWQVGRVEDDDGKKIGERKLLPDFDLIVWAGRRVYLIFDSDSTTRPILGWGVYYLGQLLQARGAEVRVVVLPPGDPGADGTPAKIGLDDFLLTHTAADLRALMAKALPPVKPEPDTAIEADDDPHRLARIFVEQQRHQGLLDSVRFWREEWFRWECSAYRRLPDKELGAELTACAKAEFDRLNIEAQKQQRKQKEQAQEDAGSEEGGKKKKPGLEPARKVTTGLTADVRQGLTDLCSLPSTVETPAWLSPDDEWDAADVLACCNGLVYLPSLVSDKIHLMPPTPLFFSRNALDYDFDFDAPPCKEWLAFLNNVWPDDPQSIDTLAEWFGYTLTPNTSQQKIMMMVGPPRSGKGTIARVHRRLIGEANVCSPTLSSLSGPFGLQPLLGKTLGIVSDARLSRRSDVATITERLLSISGEDGQSVDRKHLPSVDGKLSVRFEILTNELPRLTDPSGALVSRMIVLRFVRSWLGNEDIGLTKRLLKELPGILLWAVEGWGVACATGGAARPAGHRLSTGDRTGEHRITHSAFVRDCCVVADRTNTTQKDWAVPVKELFGIWKAWCDDKGKKDQGDEMIFGRNLRSVIPALETTRPRIPGSANKGPRQYRGIRFKTPEETMKDGGNDLPE